MSRPRPSGRRARKWHDRGDASPPGAGLVALRGGFGFGLSLAVSLAPAPVVALTITPAPDTLTMSHDRVAVVPAPGVLGNDVGIVGNTHAILDLRAVARHGRARPERRLHVHAERRVRGHGRVPLPPHRLPALLLAARDDHDPQRHAGRRRRSYSATAGVTKSVTARLLGTTNSDRDALCVFTRSVSCSPLLITGGRRPLGMSPLHRHGTRSHSRDGSAGI